MTLARKGHWTTLVGLVLLGGVYVRAVVFTPVAVAVFSTAKPIFVMPTCRS